VYRVKDAYELLGEEIAKDLLTKVDIENLLDGSDSREREICN